MRREVVLIVGAFLASDVSEAAKASSSEGVAWRMPHHSFAKTLTYEDTLGDWLSSAASMALRDRMQLLPPVLERYGIFWNKKALSTRNFEMKFSMSALSDATEPNKDAAVAFWISMTNFTDSFNEQAIVATSKDWSESLKSNGFTFIGNSPKFHGLAIIFASSDRTKSDRPTITTMWGDGQKEQALPYVVDQDPIGKTTVKKEWLSPVKSSTVSVRVQPDGSIVGSLVTLKDDEVGGEFSQLFELPPSTFPNTGNAFIGFSGFSGSAGSSVEVNLEDVEVMNFDTRTMGEEATTDMLAADSSDWEKTEWYKTLSEEKRFASQGSQREAIERLTKLLKDHVDRFDGLGEKLKQDMVTMEGRLDMLGTDVANYLAAAKAYVVESETMDPKVVKEHIVGIRTLLTKGQEQNEATLLNVHNAAKDLKDARGTSQLSSEGKAKVESVHAQAQAVQEYAHRGATQTSSILLVLVVAIFGLGCLFLNRMRYYEKKHYI